MVDSKIWNEDCLMGMERIIDKSVDMILCDLPYGRTKNRWDKLIDLDKLWIQYNRIIKDDGAIVLTAQTPFDKILGASNINNLRYEWIWEKTSATGHLNAKRMPLKAHENILVFYKKLPTYNPQKTTGHTAVHSYTKKQNDGSNYGKTKIGISGGGNTERYPRSVLTFKSDKQKNNIHPTQKPVALFEYLIKTYTNEGETVLDNCMGSGTTAIACCNTNRKFIGFETNQEYYERSLQRIERHNKKLQ
ncbi:site-specific DNA-methyltransferase [Listeria seeligeri]|uniref:DNA-methyltransferase n=1 Tax=Listeria seeligeri TaxID=1640 RepID=UPI001888CA66|nr:site-specific DNA-methyltransferase [Listeria seeligeri]MBF2375158.1 site-specific DNA-methyltransferase [Listeria seeligeri]UCK61835.1 site-specific DNA-methyltransferase [Listeria seeligeri]